MNTQLLKSNHHMQFPGTMANKDFLSNDYKTEFVITSQTVCTALNKEHGILN
jgi:hypothetical protein